MLESGILLVDKPFMWTSFDVVNKIKWTLRRSTNKKIKVGHAGTLDPLATGLLIVCYGEATKKIAEMSDFNKEYEATLFLGATTPSFDKEIPIDKTFPTNHISIDMINNSVETFKGMQMQDPPIFSAKKIKGKKAYELAREGLEVVLEAREVHFHSIELIKFALPWASFNINCSKGTYIRAFARDFGLSLNSGAYLESLKRTKVGPFCLSDAIKISEIGKSLIKNG